MIYFIECLSEVKDDDVCLVTNVHISKKSMREFYKLSFAGETFVEAMLVGVKDMVCFQVTHEITYNDMFHKFAADTYQGNRSVVGRVVSVSLLV